MIVSRIVDGKEDEHHSSLLINPRVLHQGCKLCVCAIRIPSPQEVKLTRTPHQLLETCQMYAVSAESSCSLVGSAVVLFVGLMILCR